jgi:hypothetical protein
MLPLPQIVIQMPPIRLIITSDLQTGQHYGARQQCVHCACHASGTSTALKEEVSSDSTFTNEFESVFFDEDSTSQPIFNKDPNLNVANLSPDFAEPTIKDEPDTWSPKSPKYERIPFSLYSDDVRPFADIDEVISYLKDVMEYDVLIKSTMINVL